MTKPSWIGYNEEDATRNEIRRLLTGISVEFGSSEPMIEDCFCILPEKGAVCPIGESSFVFKHTKHIQEFERGYWVGGEPGYGQEWVSSSEARYLDDDDRFFLGAERFLPPEDRVETEYFYVGKAHGELLLSKIDDDCSRSLENDLASFRAGYHEQTSKRPER